MTRIFRQFCLTIGMACGLSLIVAGCGKRETLVNIGDHTGEFFLNNEGEPASLDPQLGVGVIEENVVRALFEGLLTADAKTLAPQPGAAESWETSPDGLVYTFHLHKNGRWSNGDPLTAQDFVESYHRMLMPSLGAQYSYMLYPLKNAEAYNNGKLTDFTQVGCKALDEFTLQLTLHSPAPYLPSMLIHPSWFPVPVKTIEKCGALDDPANSWNRPETMVCNGPFVLKEWKMNSHLLAERNSNYWDVANVKLKKVFFDSTDSLDTAERMFRSGQIHTDPSIPPSKVAFYRKYRPSLLKVYPYIGTYFYKLNVKRPPLNDKRVRQALAMAIDRHAIIETILRAGQLPAYCLTPPDTGGYTCQAQLTENVVKARALLAEAGYPDGKNFPTVEVLFNTLQMHKAIAEALQEMWRKNLNINIVLHNEEWKVYLDSIRRIDFSIARSSWIGDYVDPSTFLEEYITDGGNNETGWSNAEYDRLIRVASSTGDQAVRYAAYQKAEAILLDEVPCIPIYFYTATRLIRPSVKGWYPNLLDQYNFKSIYLVPQTN